MYRQTIQQAQDDMDRFLCVKGCLINNVSVELGAINDKIAETLNGHFETMKEMMGRVVKEGQELGEIDDRFTADELVEYMHSNYFGTLSRVKTLRSIEPLELSHKMTFEFLAKKT